MTTTIASATQIAKDRVAILVEAGHADSLFNFLQGKKVSCLPPADVIFRPRRAYIDSEGRKQVVDETLDCEILAKGSLEDFQKWMHEWIFPSASKSSV